MRYLGIDYGSKRVGVAISDESLTFSFPLTVLGNTDNLYFDVLKICKENNISLVVVGESKDFSFKANEIMQDIERFVLKLESLGLRVVLHPEFLTSQEALRLQGKNDMIDASAAAIILKSYLDTKSNGK